MKKEEWKDIIGYEGIYQVSNKGRVRSLDRNFVDKRGYNRFKKGQLLKPIVNSFGYCVVCLHKDRNKKNKGIHRLVCEAFLDTIEGKTQVNHKDGIKTNNYLSNLEWCNSKENSKHALENNLSKTGESHHKATLSNEQVLEMCRQLDEEKFTVKEIANMYNISIVQAFRIKSGKSWNYLTNRCKNI